MNYYHIAHMDDLGGHSPPSSEAAPRPPSPPPQPAESNLENRPESPSASPQEASHSDSSDDDPNWLITSSTVKAKRRTKAKDSSGMSENNNASLTGQDGQSQNGVVLRRKKKSEEENQTSSHNRFSKLIESVSWYRNGAVSDSTSNGNGVGELRLDGDENDVNANGDEQCNGSKHGLPPFYYLDDPIATRICELFDEIGLEEEEEEKSYQDEVAEVKRRTNEEGFFKRRKQTVSGYFSDWTKWLRSGNNNGQGEAEKDAKPNGYIFTPESN